MPNQNYNYHFFHKDLFYTKDGFEPISNNFKPSPLWRIVTWTQICASVN